MLVATCFPAYAVPSDGITTSAQLTEAKGSIYKRGFIDWSREQWGDPQNAKVGDVLTEGMQLGTGDKSYAQLAWKHITTRAWANSVYAIAPNQRLVYLLGGEMLFHLDKHRPDKDDYCVWTNLLQARIRGTTVLFQSAGDVSRVTVLEGTVDVLNRTDNSVVRIKPGVVYEIRANSNQPLNTLNPNSTHNLDQAVRTARATGLPSGSTVTSQPSPAAGGALNSTKGAVGATASTQGVISGALNSPTVPVGNVVNSTTGLVGNTVKSTTGLVGTTLNSTTGLVNGALNSTTGLVGNTLNSTTGLLGSTLNSTTGLVAGALNSTTGLAGGALNTTTGLVSGLLDSNVTGSVLSVANLSSIISNKVPAVPLFNTTKSITTVYGANADQLLANPLVQGFESTLPSIGLIHQALDQLPPSYHAGLTSATSLPTIASATQLPDKVLATNAQIMRVPTQLSYNIGSLVGKTLSLPSGSVANWPPTGWIGPEAASLIAGRPFVYNNIKPLTGGLLSAVEQKSGLPNLSILQSELPVNNLLMGPQLPGGTGLSLGSAVLPGSFTTGSILGGGSLLSNGGLLGLIGSAGGSGAGVFNAGALGGATGALGAGTGALGGVTGSLGGVTGALGGVTGSLGGVTGALGGVTGALGGVTGSLGGVTGALGGVTGSLGGVTGALGGVTGSLGGVTGALGGVTGSLGGVTGALGGVTGSLGGVTGSLGGVTGTTLGGVTGTLGGVTGTTLGGVTGTLGGVTGTTLGGVTGSLGGVTSTLGKVSGTLGGVTSTLAAPTIKVPTITVPTITVPSIALPGLGGRGGVGLGLGGLGLGGHH